VEHVGTMRYRQFPPRTAQEQDVAALMHFAPSEFSQHGSRIEEPYRIPASSSLSLIFHAEAATSGEGFSAARLSVSGPSARHRTVPVTERTHVIGVRFAVGTGAARLGVDAQSMIGAEVDVAECAAKLQPLFERLRVCGSADEVIKAFELASRVEFGTPLNDDLHRVKLALRLIRDSKIDFSVARVAEAVGLSERTLRRDFARHVGLSPLAVARVARFERAADVLSDTVAHSLADVAAMSGYADQSHMNREFVTMSGDSPRLFKRTRLGGRVTDSF